jgi:hypothetical protein
VLVYGQKIPFFDDDGVGIQQIMKCKVKGLSGFLLKKIESNLPAMFEGKDLVEAPGLDLS